MRTRRHVDWDEEVKKTEKIRSRGLKISLLSFCVAIAAIGGANFYVGKPLVGGFVLKVSFVFLFVVILCLFLARWLGRGGPR